MDARPTTRYKTLPSTRLAGGGEELACVEPVQEVGVKWVLAVLALLGTIFMLLLTPAVVAVISMVDER